MEEKRAGEKRLLMGNEAIALGAIRAGVSVATGYPGTPSSEVLETIAKERPEGVYVEWSVNEKSALEVAAGAAIAGERALVTMKQVGLNVASDPLMSLNYVGVKGGMVVMVADDPGPISSQTEQDTRSFGQYAKIAVFDPSSPEEAYTMIADAYDCSERTGRPALFRPTTRVCHSYSSVEIQKPLPRRHSESFRKDGGRWVIFPRLAYANHIKIEENLVRLSDEFSSYSGNRLTGGGRLGVASGGVSWSYVMEAASDIATDFRNLKVATVPFPRQLAAKFLDGLDSVLVVEELDPFIERELIYLCGRLGVKVDIRGKLSGDMPPAGENTPAEVRRAVRSFLGEEEYAVRDLRDASALNLPPRPPVLCAGCPHRASFYAVKEASRGRKAVFSGDIGCYTLGNASPLDMVDTCLCMGAGVAMAQGLNRAEPDAVNFAFIGDSTFFHTGIPGVVNAVYNNADIIVAVLDNSTTAMTGGQPHPGIGRTITGEPARKLSIYDVLASVGVGDIQRVNAFDLFAAKNAAARAIEGKGVRAIIFEGECIALSGGNKTAMSVDDSKCVGCGVCVRELGCPALSMEGKKASVDGASCTGCEVCVSLCKFGALGGDAA
ncbi:MAG: indolepyruvate ferredoxin oxidoreductase subunit alpha [Synergistaceae bacterium]|jgi:indolepyruvate ferredoxin oxidoreductase alpha subunit|nr:indolepyruvate ferredoxin oxidoreductase subunit alpha [Synergistaceae bacterium]